MSDKQPEALLIADQCDESAKLWANEVRTCRQAAALLRAQHAEIALLHERHHFANEEFARLRAAIERKDALLRRLISALDSDRHDVDDWPPESCEVVYAIKQELSQ